MSSILTNSSSMVALQTLRNINKDLGTVQSNIATGKTVATAKDNAAFWSISQYMDSDVKGFKAVNESLAFADSAVNIGRVGAETVVDLLGEIKAKLVSAVDGTADQATIQADIDELVLQIDETIAASGFNGTNLLTAAADTTFLASLNRTNTTTVAQASITVAEQDTAVSAVTTAIGAYDATSTASGDLTNIETQIDAMVQVAAALGTAGARVEVQTNFNTKVSDALKQGIGAITDTDMEEASARLQALQVQQQLGVQALSIANQQPQTLLSLFR